MPFAPSGFLPQLPDDWSDRVKAGSLRDHGVLTPFEAKGVSWIYTGLLHALLDLGREPALAAYSRVGASWEGFAIEQILRAVQPAAAYHWRTHGGASLDLFFSVDGQRHGLEIKASESPTIGKSMRVALEDLRLDRLWIIYPGEHEVVLDERIVLLPLHSIGMLPGKGPPASS